MPSRPDLREISTNVRDAFADADRDSLLDILTFVLKEYVVEGPPPMLIHQAETLSDLQGVSFAQLISALQTRFDHPELAMFVVDGERVSVRIGGVVQPLVPTRQPLQAPPPEAPAVPSAPAELPRPSAGVRVVETTLQQRPPQQGSAPPPARGLAVRGQPTGAAVAPVQPQPAPGQPAQPAADKPASDPPEGSGDEGSSRFSLLELD